VPDFGQAVVARVRLGSLYASAGEHDAALNMFEKALNKATALLAEYHDAVSLPGQLGVSTKGGLLGAPGDSGVDARAGVDAAAVGSDGPQSVPGGTSSVDEEGLASSDGHRNAADGAGAASDSSATDSAAMVAAGKTKHPPFREWVRDQISIASAVAWYEAARSQMALQAENQAADTYAGLNCDVPSLPSAILPLTARIDCQVHKRRARSAITRRHCQRLNRGGGFEPSAATNAQCGNFPLHSSRCKACAVCPGTTYCYPQTPSH